MNLRAVVIALVLLQVLALAVVPASADGGDAEGDAPHNAVAAATPGSRFSVSADKQTVFDHVTGLRWRRAVAPQIMTWPVAEAYCASLPADVPGAVWRLPHRSELMSLVNRQVKAPTIAHADFPKTPKNWTWTSSALVAFGGGAYWIVSFESGIAGYSGPTGLSYVRCVR